MSLHAKEKEARKARAENLKPTRQLHGLTSPFVTSPRKAHRAELRTVPTISNTPISIPRNNSRLHARPPQDRTKTARTERKVTVATRKEAAVGGNDYADSRTLWEGGDFPPSTRLGDW